MAAPGSSPGTARDVQDTDRGMESETAYEESQYHYYSHGASSPSTSETYEAPTTSTTTTTLRRQHHHQGAHAGSGGTVAGMWRYELLTVAVDNIPRRWKGTQVREWLRRAVGPTLWERVATDGLVLWGAASGTRPDADGLYHDGFADVTFRGTRQAAEAARLVTEQSRSDRLAIVAAVDRERPTVYTSGSNRQRRR